MVFRTSGCPYPPVPDGNYHCRHPGTSYWDPVIGASQGSAGGYRNLQCILYHSFYIYAGNPDSPAGDWGSKRGNSHFHLRPYAYGEKYLYRIDYSGQGYLRSVQGNGKHTDADPDPGHPASGFSCDFNRASQYDGNGNFHVRTGILYRRQRLGKGYLPGNQYLQSGHDLCRKYFNRFTGPDGRLAAGDCRKII